VLSTYPTLFLAKLSYEMNNFEVFLKTSQKTS